MTTLWRFGCTLAFLLFSGLTMTETMRIDVPERLQPGTRLRHYKGGLYEVTGACIIEATLETGILYRPLQGDAGHLLWMRPASAFFEQVETPAGVVSRFASV
jgi:hypothetical protein